MSLISHSKCRTVLGTRFAPIVKPRGEDVGMAEPILDLRDIGLMGESVRGRCRAQRMDAQPIHFGADTGLQTILPYNILIHRGRIERAI